MGFVVRGPIGSNPECRCIVEQLVWMETWSPWVIRVTCVLLGCLGFTIGLHRGQVSLASLALGLLVGMIAAWVVNWLVGRLLIGPLRSVCYTGVAQRLRSRTIVHCVRDWRIWEHGTPGVAALVQSDQLFLCDHSTGYDELLLSSWQIGAATVKQEPVAHRGPKQGRRAIPEGAFGWVRSRTFGCSGQLSARGEEGTVLEIHYFVRQDKPVRSTRIPFGLARRDAEGWMAAIEQAKLPARSVQ